MPKNIPSNHSNPSRNCKKNNSSTNNSSSLGDSSNTNSNGSNGNSSSKLCCFGYVDYIVLASTLAIALGEELDNTDLNILSTFFAVLSDELALISSVNSCFTGDTDDTFVAPVPDVAITRSGKKHTSSKGNRTRIKKIIKRRKKEIKTL